MKSASTWRWLAWPGSLLDVSAAAWGLQAHMQVPGQQGARVHRSRGMSSS